MFPELVIHGHCTPNTWELAEPVPDGPSVRRLIQIARLFRLVLCVGLSEKERDICYNTVVVVGPNGYISKQPQVAPVALRMRSFVTRAGREHQRV